MTGPTGSVGFQDICADPVEASVYCSIMYVFNITGFCAGRMTAGIIGLLGVLAGDVPPFVVAVTVNVYVVPFVNPVMTHVVCPVVSHCLFPGVDVATYLFTGRFDVL